MYIVRDTIAKNIFALIKNLYDGKREYIVFGDIEDYDRVTSVIIDDKDGIVCECFVYQDGSLNPEKVGGDFFDNVENMDISNRSLTSWDREYIKMLKECCSERNINNHEWFQSKIGDVYTVYG